MVCDRSPCATAPITRAVSLVGWTRSSMSKLTASIESRQKPVTSPMLQRFPSFPSLPTTRESRSSSCAIRSLRSTTSLNTSATRPKEPVQSAGRRTEPSPRLSAFSAPRMTVISSAGSIARSTTCMVRLRMHARKLARARRHPSLYVPGNPKAEYARLNATCKRAAHCKIYKRANHSETPTLWPTTEIGDAVLPGYDQPHHYTKTKTPRRLVNRRSSLRQRRQHFVRGERYRAQPRARRIENRVRDRRGHDGRGRLPGAPGLFGRPIDQVNRNIGNVGKLENRIALPVHTGHLGAVELQLFEQRPARRLHEI